MIADSVAAFLPKLSRQFTNRGASVGASEIGMCARRVFYAKKRTPYDSDYKDSRGAMTRGIVYEQFVWEPALRAQHRTNLLFAGAHQKTFVDDLLSATPDGLLINQPRNALAALGVLDIGEGQCFAVECKTIDERTHLVKPKPENVFQAQVQLGLFREKTEFRPEYALISYTYASTYEVKEFPVQRDPAVFENAKARARMIMTATSASELKPEGWIAGGRECEWCPFAKTCGRQRAAVPPSRTAEINTQFAAEVADLARECKRRETDAETADIKLRETQAAIKDRLRERGVRRVESENITVLWSDVKGRSSYNHTAVREAAIAAGVDVTQFSTTGEPSDRLTVRIND